MNGVLPRAKIARLASPPRGIKRACPTPHGQNVYVPSQVGYALWGRLVEGGLWKVLDFHLNVILLPEKSNITFRRMLYYF